MKWPGNWEKCSLKSAQWVWPACDTLNRWTQIFWSICLCVFINYHPSHLLEARWDRRSVGKRESWPAAKFKRHKAKLPWQIAFLSESAYRYAFSLKKEIMSRLLDFRYVSMEKNLGAYALWVLVYTCSILACVMSRKMRKRSLKCVTLSHTG